MQIIALDTSLNSTAVTIYDKNSQYHFFSWRHNLKPDNIWNASMPWCKMFDVQYQEVSSFTAGEVLKLEDYLKLASNIASVVDTIIDPNLPTKVMIEGYSQKSSAGKDHDLVGYGTLVRLKMYSKYNSLNVIPPKSLKKFSARLAYPNSAILVNKKGKAVKDPVFRNNVGVAGGSFDKFHMFQAIVDYKHNDALSKWCALNWTDIKTRSSIPKPADDLVDAFWLCEVGRNNLV
jgi:hypothetical protein